MSELGWRHRLLEIGGRRVPFPRWSVLRVALGGRALLHTWEEGDLPEDALRQFPGAHARAGAGGAGRIWGHGGVGDRVSVGVGSVGDGGKTIAALSDEHGFAPGSLDFVFIDHDKAAYLPDLELILDAGWLHSGSVVVADN